MTIVAHPIEIIEEDTFEAISKSSSDAIEKAGGTAAKKMGEKLGVKYAEDGAIDIGETALDAIPFLGEVAGVAQIFHSLFKEHKIRARERKEESSAARGILSGGSVAAGGLDVSSVTNQLAQVSGLV